MTEKTSMPQKIKRKTVQLKTQSRPLNQGPAAALHPTPDAALGEALPFYFGEYGGRYVPELLQPALAELAASYLAAKKSASFKAELKALLKNYAGRPTPLTEAKNLARHLFGKKKVSLYLKNEGLLHTGAHKLNNALGQALLAKRMGKRKLIAETGAGQHGLATASAAAKLAMEATIFMGAVDVARQYPNTYRMRVLGAKVVAVEDGTKTLKDAVTRALKYWIENLTDYHYIIGSALGPHPYPAMVRDFQTVIGEEVKEQLQAWGKKASRLIACVGGGSNSLGFFYPFLNEAGTVLMGVEAGGRGNKKGEHAARFKAPQVGVSQGYKSYFLQSKEGQLSTTHSISAGLDYAGIGPELAFLGDEKKVHFSAARDSEVLEAFQLLARQEGIFAALESAHAVAGLIKHRKAIAAGEVVVVNISGRGDKDLFITAKELEGAAWRNFLQQEAAQ